MPERRIARRRGPALALRYSGRKRLHDAAEMMAAIVANASWSIWNGPDSSS
jgi:hypothetical protein